MAKLKVETIKELVKKYPNDIDLGKEIRKFLNKIETKKVKSLSNL
jgi:hypothetical protein